MNSQIYQENVTVKNSRSQAKKKEKYNCLRSYKYDSWTCYDNKKNWSAKWNSLNFLTEILSESYTTFKIWNQIKKNYSNWT